MSEPTHQAMNACLSAVWQRNQRKHALGGLLAFARWFVPLFLIAILIDRFAYFPAWFRALVGLAILIVSLRQAWRHGLSSLQRFDAIRTARQIEESHGGMDSLLVTAVHFQQHGASPGTSEEMWALTQRKAHSAAKDVQPGKVVSMKDLQRPLRIAMVVAGVVILGSILHGSFLIAGLGRLFTPWQAIAYPTKTKIDLGDGELVFKEGSPAKLDIHLRGSVPKTAKLEIQTGKGRPREIALEVIDGLGTYEIASASRDFSFRVKAGDARSEWQQVRVIAAPRMAKVKLELDFPDYIDRGNEQVEALTLTVPEETKVSWHLTLDTPIRKATLHRDGSDDLPLEIGPDGRTLTLSETATASRGYSFSWTEDRHGFDFESPRYFLQVASDQPPRVELTSPETNLSAMLGRPLQFAVRAHDDHGIGVSTITYRVNLRPEKTVTLDPPLANGEGEQKIAWDYRKEITDLQVGDTVSFVIEVADKYPGENGAHRARTESRRITFLSREDYLAEVTKQMEKLLNRVRALYRQERAAHELVLGLDTKAESFVPTCQLEAIRQEMVREQLLTTATEVQTLLDDLAANQVSDAVENRALTAAQGTLRTIANEQVAQAANLLRAQVGAKTRDSRPAVEAVNQAARELAKLVLMRGIDPSREVFARETHVIACDLARLRQALLSATPDQAGPLAKDHESLAAWTTELLDKLSAAMTYDKRPLAVLGLSRRIYDLRQRGVAKGMEQVAGLAKAGKLSEAAAAQYPLIRPLMECEFPMRAGSEYAMIKNLREQLGRLAVQQQELHAATSAQDSDKQAAELAQRQRALRDQLVLASLPGIPAPRAKLSDLQWPSTPPTDELRLKAESLMSSSAGHLKAKATAQAIASQQEAIATLKQLDSILALWSDELAQKSIGASAQVSEATDRVTVLQKLENRQVVLLEQTEEAALDKKNPKALLEDQQSIADELGSFAKELSAGGAETPKHLLPLVGRMATAGRILKRAAETLKENRLEDALEPQEQAAAVLGEARKLAQEQLSRISLLQQLIGFEQAVATATNGMGDIVGGQNDLIAATKVADKKALAALLAPQRNLHACLGEIAPALDLVAARLDVGTPLVFAASDVEDALASMEDGDGEDAADLQTIAIESLTKVKNLVGEISAQTGYVAEIVEHLQAAQNEASMFAFRQRQVREEAAPKDALTLQQVLSSDTAAYGHGLTETAGKVDPAKIPEAVMLKLGEADLTLDFDLPAKRMKEAMDLLKSGQAATEAMLAAEKSLDSTSSQINLIVSMLNGLPSIALSKASPPELKRLIDILDVASKHRGLLRRTQGADAKEMTAIAGTQQKLSQAVSKAVQNELGHPLLSSALEEMAKAEKAFTSSNKEDALRAQLAADQHMRHFIIEQALILNTAPVPPMSSDQDVVTEAETDDLYFSESVGFLSDFVSGEAPKDKKSEWEFLGTRNRAALNQNFARELPLEYRATLKNYYERVAK